MRILIANDDGIYSPGIATLAEVASKFGDVRVVAPDVEQSTAGHAITAMRPLSYRRTPIGNFEAYRVNGTPADCVALGAYHWETVDVVLSGINLGSNLGNSMWHSGTLAAAKAGSPTGIARHSSQRGCNAGRAKLRDFETVARRGFSVAVRGS
jgi:5'-nucleotidase